MQRSRPSVILVHGLWMSPLFMKMLGLRLKRAGFQPCYFGYPTVRGDYGEQVRRLQALIQRQAAPVYLVGHSLGGLLALDALSARAGKPAARLVLLGSPLAGSHIARLLSRSRIGRWLLGAAGPRLQQQSPAIPAHVNALAIVGSRRIGLSRLLPGVSSAPGDGAVDVAEASAELPDSAVQQVPLNHIGLLFSRRVTILITGFLCQ